MAEMKKKRRRRRKKKKVVVLTPEEKFTKLMNLRRATRCILDVNEKYKIYVRLARDFHEFGISEEAAEVEGAEECETLSRECFEKAEELKPMLSADADKDTRTVTTTMKKKEAEALMNRGKKKSKGRILTLVILGLLVTFIICYEVTPTRYWITALEKALGMNQMAMEGYHKLGDYKDSREKMMEARYDYAVSLSEQGQYEPAREQFSRLAAKGYKDSERQTAQTEMVLLADSKPKDVVHYGTCRWLVLEQDRPGNRVLLTKYIGLKGKPYHDREEPVTWEQCSLRTFLNGEFMDIHFSETEQQYILMSRVTAESNASYGTDGGRDTEDKLFLPSGSEIEKYRKILKTGRNNMRLRTPGKKKETTAFISYRGKQIDYGFPVDQAGALVRPTMWVSTSIK